MSLLEKVALDASSKFLQTVLVIDDQAYAVPVDVTVPEATLGDESPYVPAEGGGDSDTEEFAPSESNDFDTQAVVKAFADLGMNCAVLAPASPDQSEDTNRLIRLAKRADIVVLDWVLRSADEAAAAGDGAETTSLPMLEQLLAEDIELGARLRLVCIYTGDRDLVRVVGALEASLGEIGPVRTDAARRTLFMGGAKIVVLPKAGGRSQPGLETVDFADLPTRVVQEFSDHASNGILSQLALSALGAVRDGAFRLLTRFDSNLDAALLTHRALSSGAATEKFALALIGDELAAIVAAERVTPSLADEVVEAVVGKLQVRKPDPMKTWKSRTSAFKSISKDDSLRAFIDGVDTDGKIRNGSGQAPTLGGSLTHLLVDSDDESTRRIAERVDLRFAALSSLSRDALHDAQGLTPPDLHLGTLVRIDTLTAASGAAPASDADPVASDSSYWLCMQPLCDSVRLEGPTRFPFLPLKVSEDHSPEFDLVVRSGSEYLRLNLGKRKFNSIEFFEMTPDRSLSVVLANWDEEWLFERSDGETLIWLGDVRLDMSHKLIGDIVNDAGRIGIDEFEYSRRSHARS